MLFVSGFFVGGYFLVLFVIDEWYLIVEGLFDDVICGVILVGGIYDVEYYFCMINDGFGV